METIIPPLCEFDEHRVERFRRAVSTLRSLEDFLRATEPGNESGQTADIPAPKPTTPGKIALKHLELV